MPTDTLRVHNDPCTIDVVGAWSCEKRNQCVVDTNRFCFALSLTTSIRP